MLPTFISEYFNLSAIIFLVAGVTAFVVRTNIRLKHLEEAVFRIEKTLTKLSDIFMQRFGEPVAGSSSPITLTDYGKDISNQVDAKSISDIYVDLIKADAAGKNPYEIQEICFDYAKTKMLEHLKENHPDKYNVVVNYAYQSGIEAQKVTYVIGIELRDKLLDLLELSPKEIDSHVRQS